jgi:polyisoprenoid-binding protein YceI
MRSSRTRAAAVIMIAALLALLFALPSLGQTPYNNNSVAKVTIFGTSNIHDWEMESSQGKANATITLNPAGQLTALSNLSFVMAVQTLKSGKGAMDDNTYKAMKEKQFPTLQYVAPSATVKSTGGSNYSLSTSGKLTIAGTTHDIVLNGTATVNADKSITVTGSYAFDMTEYNVTPPSIMFGTIKVGPPITVKFSLTLKP